MPFRCLGRRRHVDRGRLWSHNDSGHAPMLHEVDESGRTTQRAEVAGFAVDWEDLAAFH
jgi:hypothetical protein